MIKWTLPLACALVLSACGTAGTYDTGAISSAPHIDPDRPAAGATTGGSVTDVTGEGAAAPTVSGPRGGTTSGGTTGASGTTGTTGTIDREPGAISSAPHIDPDRPAAGATTGGSVTDVTGEGAAAPTVSGPRGGTSGSMDSGTTDQPAR